MQIAIARIEAKCQNLNDPGADFMKDLQDRRVDEMMMIGSHDAGSVSTHTI